MGDARQLGRVEQNDRWMCLGACREHCDVTVVRLGARCDLDEAGPDAQLRFSVVEFVDLDDGRRVELRHLGWTSRVVGSAPTDPWSYETRASIEETVRAVVLPDDDDEASTEAHPWQWLVNLASEQGVATSVAELRAVPYVVEIGKGVLARLPTGT